MSPARHMAAEPPGSVPTHPRTKWILRSDIPSTSLSYPRTGYTNPQSPRADRLADIQQVRPASSMPKPWGRARTRTKVSAEKRPNVSIWLAWPRGLLRGTARLRPLPSGDEARPVVRPHVGSTTRQAAAAGRSSLRLGSARRTSGRLHLAADCWTDPLLDRLRWDGVGSGRRGGGAVDCVDASASLVPDEEGQQDARGRDDGQQQRRSGLRAPAPLA